MQILGYGSRRVLKTEEVFGLKQRLKFTRATWNGNFVAFFWFTFDINDLKLGRRPLQQMLMRAWWHLFLYWSVVSTGRKTSGPKTFPRDVKILIPSTLRAILSARPIGPNLMACLYGLSWGQTPSLPCWKAKAHPLPDEEHWSASQVWPWPYRTWDGNQKKTCWRRVDLMLGL